MKRENRKKYKVYGLASFSQRFIENFSVIVALLNDFVFKWGKCKRMHSIFLGRNQAMHHVLPSFDKTFEIGGVATLLMA